MLSISPPQIQEIAFLAKISDKEIRSDLQLGMIKDENDYTSNFTGAFRRNIYCYSRTGISASSWLLPKPIEEFSGCDATIIIQSNGAQKVILFEAKWPRLGKPSYAWDYAQTSTGLSHFSDQLDRQSNHHSKYAIFEIFYSEHEFGKQPSEMIDEGSTCVWHTEAMNFKSSRVDPNKIWDRSDLTNLFRKQSLGIGQIITDVCQCKAGTPIAMPNVDSLIQEFRITGDVLVINFGECEEEWMPNNQINQGQG